MSFLGKEYKFEKEENFADLVSALGLPAEEAQGFINYRPTQKFVQDGDSYTFITVTPQTKNELTFKSGVAFDEKISNRNCNTTFTVGDNTITQVHKFDDGGEMTISRKFNGNELVVTITTNRWNGTATRYYKA